eukprot:TRINITY_DN7861_c0_g1_i2.p1 TRINITY_DN7861_c0_g1~~TRINITY_DN7861_c0_g1_i2.p1  ORF type:complete len:988 (-),score=167.69 TRINITY_DN7861_c0_g1_i2:172-3135(-)
MASKSGLMEPCWPRWRPLEYQVLERNGSPARELSLEEALAAHVGGAINPSLDELPRPPGSPSAGILSQSLAGAIAAQDSGGQSLRVAARLGRLGVCRSLLELRVDPTGTDASRTTALHCAAFSGSATLVELLITRRCDPGARDSAFQTALFFASSRAVCDVLAGARADVNALNVAGQSALHLASQADEVEVMEWLVSTMSPRMLNLADRSGQTAFDYATGSRSRAATRLLRLRGARPSKVVQVEAETRVPSPRAVPSDRSPSSLHSSSAPSSPLRGAVASAVSATLPTAIGGPLPPSAARPSGRPARVMRHTLSRRRSPLQRSPHGGTRRSSGGASRCGGSCHARSVSGSAGARPGPQDSQFEVWKVWKNVVNCTLEGTVCWALPAMPLVRSSYILSPAGAVVGQPGLLPAAEEAGHVKGSAEASVSSLVENGRALSARENGDDEMDELRDTAGFVVVSVNGATGDCAGRSLARDVSRLAVTAAYRRAFVLLAARNARPPTSPPPPRRPGLRLSRGAAAETAVEQVSTDDAHEKATRGEVSTSATPLLQNATPAAAWPPPFAARPSVAAAENAFELPLPEAPMIVSAIAAEPAVRPPAESVLDDGKQFVTVGQQHRRISRGTSQLLLKAVYKAAVTARSAAPQREALEVPLQPRDMAKTLLRTLYVGATVSNSVLASPSETRLVCSAAPIANAATSIAKAMPPSSESWFVRRAAYEAAVRCPVRRCQQIVSTIVRPVLIGCYKKASVAQLHERTADSPPSHVLVNDSRAATSCRIVAKRILQGVYKALDRTEAEQRKLSHLGARVLLGGAYRSVVRLQSEQAAMRRAVARVALGVVYSLVAAAGGVDADRHRMCFGREPVDEAAEEPTESIGEVAEESAEEAEDIIDPERMFQAEEADDDAADIDSHAYRDEACLAEAAESTATADVEAEDKSGQFVERSAEGERDVIVAAEDLEDAESSGVAAEETDACSCGEAAEAASDADEVTR